MHVMAERGMNTADKRLVKTVIKRVPRVCGTIEARAYYETPQG